MLLADFMPDYASGSDVITPASSFWIESASLAVTPSPRAYTSALSTASAVSGNLSLFAKNWSIATASATDTFLSRLASPRSSAPEARLLVVTVSEAVTVVAEDVEPVVVVVVVAAVEVAAGGGVVVLTITGIS